MAQKNEIYDKILNLFPQLGWKKILEIKNKIPAYVFATRDKNGDVKIATVTKEANSNLTYAQVLNIALKYILPENKREAIVKSLLNKEITAKRLDTIIAYVTNNKPILSKVKDSTRRFKKLIKPDDSNTNKENPTIKGNPTMS
ncbi:MAG: hypothetical protein IKQ31_00995 [Clostridia bacterium]|nr:hypothetical protein [Clostridia bacterium]